MSLIFIWRRSLRGTPGVSRMFAGFRRGSLRPVQLPEPQKNGKGAFLGNLIRTQQQYPPPLASSEVSC